MNKDTCLGNFFFIASCVRQSEHLVSLTMAIRHRSLFKAVESRIKREAVVENILRFRECVQREKIRNQMWVSKVKYPQNFLYSVMLVLFC